MKDVVGERGRAGEKDQKKKKKKKEKIKRNNRYKHKRLWSSDEVNHTESNVKHYLFTLSKLVEDTYDR